MIAHDRITTRARLVAMLLRNIITRINHRHDAMAALVADLHGRESSASTSVIFAIA